MCFCASPKAITVNELWLNSAFSRRGLIFSITIKKSLSSSRSLEFCRCYFLRVWSVYFTPCWVKFCDVCAVSTSFEPFHMHPPLLPVSFFLPCGFPVVQYHLLKEMIMSPWHWSLLLLQKSVDYFHVGLFLGSPLCLIDPFISSLCRFRTIHKLRPCRIDVNYRFHTLLDLIP